MICKGDDHMARIAYFNGKIGNYEDMTIPFSDRSVFYGDAIYDAVLVLDRKAFALEMHLDRLYKSCAMTEIDFDMPRETLKGEIKQTESFIEQTQAKIKDIDSKYSDECPFDEIRHSDRIDNKRIFNSQEINEVLENIDYRREYK